MNKTENKILITGSNSFVGNEITKYLSKYNYNIVATYRKNKKFFKSKKIKFAKIDLNKKINFKEKFDVLVHCASATPANEKRENYNRINEVGFKELLNLCLKSECSKIILMSSVAVYGDVREIITEKSPIKGKSKYAKSKIKMEKILSKFTKKNKVSSVVLRLSQVVGKNSVNNYFSDLKKKISTNKRKKINLQSKPALFNNLCHIDDLCINIKKLLDRNNSRKISEIFNFNSNKPIKITTFKKIIYSLNKKILFEENNIPKFYKISSNKNKIHNLKFHSTVSVIKSTLIDS